MKRRDLEKAIRAYAAENGFEVTYREGGNHSIVKVGPYRSTIPRHREIAEGTAKSIRNDLGME